MALRKIFLVVFCFASTLSFCKDSKSKIVGKILHQLEQMDRYEYHKNYFIEFETDDIFKLLYTLPDRKTLSSLYRRWSMQPLFPIMVGGYGALLGASVGMLLDMTRFTFQFVDRLADPPYWATATFGAFLAGWIARLIEDHQRNTLLDTKRRLTARLKHLLHIPSVENRPYNFEDRVEHLLNSRPDIAELYKTSSEQDGYHQKDRISTWIMLESVGWASGCTAALAKLMGAL